jgi:osmoprotectant transport system ATP-binding protein
VLSKVGEVLALEQVSKRYPNGHVAVHELSLTVGDGQTCVLVGPSGCGKTTTLRMINRLIEPSSGRVLLDGEDVTTMDSVRLRLRMGYVIQQVGLFPHMTVAGNVATVPRLLGWQSERTRRRVEELLDLVGLDPGLYAKRYPHQLSGGQQQRVGVARALGADPPVLLMDEPFGAIDRVNRDRLQNEFLRIQSVMKKIVVFVTHDIDEAVKMGDRIAILREGGVLQQYDTPAMILAEPATAFVVRRPRLTAAGGLQSRVLRSMASSQESGRSHPRTCHRVKEVSPILSWSLCMMLRWGLATTNCLSAASSSHNERVQKRRLNGLARSV